LEALYRAGNTWKVRFDGADWSSKRAGWYQMGDVHVTEKKDEKKFLRYMW
jgi:hypothetical protein